MSAPLIYSRVPLSDLYNYGLASIMHSGWRVYDPDWPTTKEPDVWEEIRRDPDIMHSMEMRRHSIAGPDWHCESRTDQDADKLAAKVDQELLGNIENLHQARYELSKAVFLARAYGFIQGERRRIRIADTEEREWWVPVQIEDVDRRRFFIHPAQTVDSTGAPDISARWKIYSWKRRQWEDWQNPEYFIKAVYSNSEDRLGYGRGLLEAIYFYWFCKQKVLQEGLQGFERWCQGFLIGKVDGLREGDTGRFNDKIVQTMQDELEKHRSRHVLVIDKLDEVEVVQHPGTGHQMVLDLLNYFKNSITQLVLGGVLPTGGDEGKGSLARSETEERSRDILIQYDRLFLDDTLTRDAIGLVRRLNKENYAALGLDYTRPSKFRTIFQERSDPEQAARVAVSLLGQGIPLKSEEVYNKTGFTQPREGDDTISGPQGQAPASGAAAPPPAMPPQTDQGFMSEIIKAIFNAGAQSGERRSPAVGVRPFNLEKAQSMGIRPPGRRVEEYDQAELRAGIEIEAEHTDDPEVAALIAANHLDEIPDYYTRLRRLEKEAQGQLRSVIRARMAQWDESKHERNKGKFAPKGQGQAGEGEEEKPPEEPKEEQTPSQKRKAESERSWKEWEEYQKVQKGETVLNPKAAEEALRERSKYQPKDWTAKVTKPIESADAATAWFSAAIEDPRKDKEIYLQRARLGYLKHTYLRTYRIYAGPLPSEQHKISSQAQKSIDQISVTMFNHTQATKTECAALVTNSDGQTFQPVIGDGFSVTDYEYEFVTQPDEGYTFIHTHPNATPHSATDYACFFTNPNQTKSVVVSAGQVYHLEKPPGWTAGKYQNMDTNTAANRIAGSYKKIQAWEAKKIQANIEQEFSKAPDEIRRMATTAPHEITKWLSHQCVVRTNEKMAKKWGLKFWAEDRKNA